MVIFKTVNVITENSLRLFKLFFTRIPEKQAMVNCNNCYVILSGETNVSKMINTDLDIFTSD